MLLLDCCDDERKQLVVTNAVTTTCFSRVAPIFVVHIAPRVIADYSVILRNKPLAFKCRLNVLSYYSDVGSRFRSLLCHRVFELIRTNKAFKPFCDGHLLLA